MSLMSRLLFVVLLGAVLLAGCKRQAPPSAEATADAAAAPPSPRGPGPMPQTAAPAVVTDTGDINNTLAQLSEELRKYAIRTRSMPKDFDDFASKSQVQFPPAPAGKR